MGFGLHAGWSIVGAIGTTHKIDASYLSSHVNMSGHMEESTKAYGVPLLATEAFHTLLSKGAQRRCRCVDRVRVKGGDDPFRLYTFDVTNSTALLATEGETWVDFASTLGTCDPMGATRELLIRGTRRGRAGGEAARRPARGLPAHLQWRC